ncbi:hypothetical protein [Planococcus shenhongbingii]|uniref:Type II secretion system protein n=1 Tax=Planococcus shenhongbingii TaxID=3058398 RepID=A0ABT8NDJ8_9BACL|nr:hypothetical protein [Planococcus sp. N017]MDN7245752.1 hypothetical protein [Planococcus sp. N017]
MSIWEKEGWFSLNEQGFSWAETMLSLFMLFILFGTLLPVMQQLQQSIHLKKERLIAYETLHEGAKEIHSLNILQGERRVNGVTYSWEMKDELCVSYQTYKQTSETICIE